MKLALKKLIQYLKAYIPQLLFIMVFAMMGAAFGILGPKLLGEITNEVQAGIGFNPLIGEWIINIDFTAIYQIVFILAGLYLASYAFNLTQGIMISRLTQKITKTLRTDLYQKMDKLPLKYFDKTSHGDTLSRMTNDIDTIGQALNSSVHSCFLDYADYRCLHHDAHHQLAIDR